MTSKYVQFLASVAVMFFVSTQLPAQVANISSKGADRFPYAFNNFVWWSDTDLRTELRRRIPGLSDEIVSNSPIEEKIRMVLVQLLKQKNIQAPVQVLEPASDALKQKRDPDAPPVAIVFTLIPPPDILIAKLVLENAPAESINLLNETANTMKEKRYTSNLWFTKKTIRQSLEQLGYLSAAVTLTSGAPNKDGDRYLVPLIATINSGPKYHVSSVKVEGGPLLQGRDLSSYVTLKPGDVATPNAFGRLAGMLRSVYWHAGFRDVEFHGDPKLDETRALASYQFEVTPGSLYHLRGLKVENLEAAQEEQVRNILGLKSGDVYDGLAVANLERRLHESTPALKAYGVSYSPHEDKDARVVDLTLNFYKQ
jgi:outer membrane translocation and assembly module TamA